MSANNLAVLESDKRLSDTDFYSIMLDPAHPTRDMYGAFQNWGYWTATTGDHQEASRNQVEMLLRLAPALGRSILDVGCGVGGVAELLCERFVPAQVTGINISEVQIEACRRRVPGANFLTMDATKMDFADNSFDTVISVEALYELNRKACLKEILRVLKPGGHLIFSDYLGCPIHDRATDDDSSFYLPDPAYYQELLRKIGFRQVIMCDVTEDTVVGHLNYALWYLRNSKRCAAHDRQAYEAAARGQLARIHVRYCVYAAAQKPPVAPSRPWSSAARDYVFEALCERV